MTKVKLLIENLLIKVDSNFNRSLQRTISCTHDYERIVKPLKWGRQFLHQFLPIKFCRAAKSHKNCLFYFHNDMENHESFEFEMACLFFSCKLVYFSRTVGNHVRSSLLLHTALHTKSGEYFARVLFLSTFDCTLVIITNKY